MRCKEKLYKPPEKSLKKSFAVFSIVKTEELKIIFEEVKCEKRFDEPMRKHTSFRIGGNADLLIFPRGTDDLKNIVCLCREKRIPSFILGFGTNLLVKDGGIRGVVVSLRKEFGDIKRQKEGDGNVESRITNHEPRITAGAGAGLRTLVNFTIKNELSGMEFASGIPGSVGGALVMNAGAKGGEMKDVVKSVSIMTSKGEAETLKNEDIKFSYRSSKFPSGSVILRAELLLKKGNGRDIRKTMKFLAMERKTKQPISSRSAGSVFKNPPGNFAGRLIESAGLKGFSAGDAVVSEKHANFIINKGNATAKDVLKLIEIVKERVLVNTGVSLEEEIKIVGEDDVY